ncbi:MAG: zinc ribbon domain-containing protein [Armatimonadetes bacterium]|nr:zinc ribbon domain-containing protein [Armatimonadota bacterium]
MSETSRQALINPGGETPSPLCDELLRGARDVRDGRMPAADLERMVAGITGEVQRARRETMANIGEAGPQHAKQFESYIHALDKSFDDMEAALRAVAHYARSLGGEDFKRAEQLLIEAALSSQYAMDGYQRAELEQGPTPMPIVNLLIRFKDGFIAGSVETADFVQTVQGAVQMTGFALEELERAPDPQPAALQGLKEAYARQIENLKALERAIPEGGASIENAMQDVLASSERVRGAIATLNTAIMSQGPSRLERTNIFLNVARAYQDRMVPPHVLSNAIEELRRDIDAERKEVERAASMPNISVNVQEQLGPTYEAYELHAPALELFERFVAGEPTYEKACERLLEASELLADCRDAFDEIATTEGKVSCVRCGTPNDPGGRACVKCGAVLPQMPGMDAASTTMSYQETDGEVQMAGELVMTENLVRLFEAVNAVAEGQMEPEEFEEVLVWMDDLLATHLSDLAPAPTFRRGDDLTDEDLQQLQDLESELRRWREIMQEGGQEFRAALQLMQYFLEDDDKNHLLEGVRTVRDAAVKIQQSDKAIEDLARRLQAAAEKKE